MIKENFDWEDFLWTDDTTQNLAEKQAFEDFWKAKFRTESNHHLFLLRQSYLQLLCNENLNYVFGEIYRELRGAIEEVLMERGEI